MAGIPVNNNLNALANAVNQAAAAKNSQSAYANASYANQEEALKDTFDMVMSRMNNAQSAQNAAAQSANAQKTNAQNANSQNANAQKASAQENAKTLTKVSTVVDTKSMSSSVNGVTKSSASDAKTSAESGENVNDASKDSVQEGISGETKDAVSKAGEELVEDVAEEMGVTPEEVEEAMEVLGITAIQLLDPANMQKLLMALSGNEDQLSIITDAELYGHLQNLLSDVSDALSELQSELGISNEELNAMIADMAAAVDPSEETEISGGLLEQPDAEDVNLEGMKDYAVTVHKDGETVEVKVTVDDAGGAKSVQEEVTETADAQPKHDAKSGNKNSSSEQKGDNNPSGNLMMQTPLEQPSVSDVSTNQPIMERFASTEDIMNQIMEYMKINLKADVQELELQLHPASLGNVHVQIAAKDGMISAQFTAQNEAVKAAIESQLVQLKNQFEEQGIKVDAVEVAVADYRFEQSFTGKEQHPGENQGNAKKGRRNINLSELDMDDMPEDMDDAERIATEMMRQSGGTVDYSA